MITKKRKPIPDDKSINIEIDVEFQSRWINDAGQVNYHKSIMVLPIPNLPLNTEGDDYTAYVEQHIKGRLLAGHALLPTRTLGTCLEEVNVSSNTLASHPETGLTYKPCWGTGSYNIVVKVKEDGLTKAQTVVGTIYNETIKQVPKL